MNARHFALGAGVIYLLVGVMGFFVTGTSMEAGHHEAPRLLGLFPLNLMHNIVHLAIGAWGVASYRSYNGSVAYARGLAVLYGLLAIMGILPEPFNTMFGLTPLFSHNIWLHAGTAAIAAYFGWMATRNIETVDASRRGKVQTIDASRHR
jgi:hypothetical protein